MPGRMIVLRRRADACRSRSESVVRRRQRRSHPAKLVIANYSAFDRHTADRVEARQKPVQRVAMRPSLLDPLFAALTTLPGVGPKLEKLYRSLFGREDTPARVIDLLFHLPTGTIDRRVAAEAARRGARHGRDRRGDRRQPPPAAAEPAARALPHRDLRRHRRR